jgi:hypothetical protein
MTLIPSSSSPCFPPHVPLSHAHFPSPHPLLHPPHSHTYFPLPHPHSHNPHLMSPSPHSLSHVCVCPPHVSLSYPYITFPIPKFPSSIPQISHPHVSVPLSTAPFCNPLKLIEALSSHHRELLIHTYTYWGIGVLSVFFYVLVGLLDFINLNQLIKIFPKHTS